jgi:hypothetical protein
MGKYSLRIVRITQITYILQLKCEVESVNTSTSMLRCLLTKFHLPADHIHVAGILSYSTIVLGYTQVLISTLELLLTLYFPIVRNKLVQTSVVWKFCCMC